MVDLLDYFAIELMDFKSEVYEFAMRWIKNEVAYGNLGLHNSTQPTCVGNHHDKFIGL